MTSNQVAYKQAKEQIRSNKEREKENIRSNKAKEKLEEKNIAQRESASKRSATTQTANTILTGLSHLINDPEWYNSDRQLVSDVANVSFNTPLGNRVPGVIKSESRTIPGIFAIGWVPTLGNNGTDFKSNVANIASRQIYSYVRYANSGARNYEPQDLMMYLIAADQLVSYHANLTRIYSTVMTSKTFNKYWLNGMLYTLGVDPEDIRDNIANLRAYINSLAVRINSFYFPNSLPIFKRHVWLNTTFFKDSPVKKSQDYVFVQERYGKYVSTDGVISFNHAKLDGDQYVEVCPTFKPGANITFKQLKELGDLLINSMAESEDIGIISGDILKAYGESNMVFTPSINQDYHIESIYSPEVLSQITNATLVARFIQTGFMDGDISPDYNQPTKPFDIRQTDDGYIYQGGKFLGMSDVADEIGPTVVGLATDYGNDYALVNTTGSYSIIDDINLDNYTINMYKDDVSTDEVMVATRLIVGTASHVMSTDGGAAKYGAFCMSYGSEIPTYGYMVELNPTNNSFIRDSLGYLFITNANRTPLQTSWPFTTAERSVKFDWSPVFNVIGYNSESPSVTSVVNTRDNANYALVNRTVLNNIHYTAIISEFGIPKLGISVRTR